MSVRLLPSYRIYNIYLYIYIYSRVRISRPTRAAVLFPRYSLFCIFSTTCNDRRETLGGAVHRHETKRGTCRRARLTVCPSMWKRWSRRWTGTTRWPNGGLEGNLKHNRNINNIEIAIIIVNDVITDFRGQSGRRRDVDNGGKTRAGAYQNNVRHRLNSFLIVY